MYCPKCATPAPEDQKFCRSCGLSLQFTALALADQAEESEASQAMSEAVEPWQSQRAVLNRWGIVTVLLSLMIGCLFLVCAGLNAFIPGIAHLIPVILGVSGFLLFGGSLLIVYASLLPKAPAGREASLLTPSGPTNKLPPEHHSAPPLGITEGTTDLLDATEAQAPVRDTAR